MRSKRASDNTALASGPVVNTGTNYSTWSFSYTPARPPPSTPRPRRPTRPATRRVRPWPTSRLPGPRRASSVTDAGGTYNHTAYAVTSASVTGVAATAPWRGMTRQQRQQHRQRHPVVHVLLGTGTGGTSLGRAAPVSCQHLHGGGPLHQRQRQLLPTRQRAGHLHHAQRPWPSWPRA